MEKEEREKQIQAAGKAIQKQIDKLNKLNCSIDCSYNTIGIFDNSISPIKSKVVHENDYSEQVVFTFNLSPKK
jgi:rRNA processing protein Krr1/Pno1